MTMEDLSADDIEQLIDLADHEQDTSPWKFFFWFIWMWF